MEEKYETKTMPPQAVSARQTITLRRTIKIRIAFQKSADGKMETGMMRFEGDWPGLFIRGDDAIGLTVSVRPVIDFAKKPLLPDRLPRSLWTCTGYLFMFFPFLPFPACFFLHLSGSGKKQGGTVKGTERSPKEGGRA
jgi:hypothetical protein